MFGLSGFSAICFGLRSPSCLGKLAHSALVKVALKAMTGQSKKVGSV